MKLIILALCLLRACPLSAEPLKVVASYDDFAAHGLRADVKQRDGRVFALLVESSDPAKILPEWMQAFYVARRDATTARPSYEFDMTKPNRVGAFIGWAETKADLVLIIGPLLREGERFQDKQYLAISASDLINWRGKNSNKNSK